MSDTLRFALSIALVAIGFLQIAGFVLNSPVIKGLGIVTVAAPLPIVFTEQKGVETFASDFFIEYDDSAGNRTLVAITPKMYAMVDAPYKFRNVIGAAISYGPILPEPLWKSVLYHAFQRPGKVARALELEPPLRNCAIIIHTKTAGRRDRWRLEIDNATP